MVGQRRFTSQQKKGHVAVARLLLDRGACINAKDSSGSTPLYCAAKKGHAAVAWLLLDRGTRLDSNDTDGTTVLMRAAVGWAEQQEDKPHLSDCGQRMNEKKSINTTLCSHESTVHLTTVCAWIRRTRIGVRRSIGQHRKSARLLSACYLIAGRALMQL